MTDVLADVRAELLREGIDAERVTRALGRVRQRWGGAQTYVLKHDREHTDAEIKAALAAGTPVKEIVHRTGVSVSTIRRRRSEWL